MKHAILIMAHKNIETLHHLVDYFNKDCYVFIHIDKKTKIKDETIQHIETKPQVVKIYRQYNVHWGGFSMLKCEMFLLKEAYKLSDADYFHLISGEDYPIKPLNEFNDFFCQRNGWKFVSYVHLPNKNFQGNTYNRFCYYLPYDLFKNRKSAQLLIPKIIKWQKRLHIKRNIPNVFEHLYGGSQWFSITRQAVNRIMQYTKSSSALYKRLRWTFAPEEVYIVTLIENLMPKACVINDNLRIIRWKYENGNYPAYLSIEHFHLLVESNSFFARKIDQKISQALVEMIDKHLISESNNVRPSGWTGFCSHFYDNGIIEAIYKYCKMAGIKDGIDCGCGSGVYVAALRRLGLNFVGFDVNDNVEAFSKLLLPTGDKPCVKADLTADLFADDCFGIVICLDVFQYISLNKLEKAIANLARLTNDTIVVSWNDDFENKYNDNKYEYVFNKLGFVKDVFVTAYFKHYLKYKKTIRVFRCRKEVHS